MFIINFNSRFYPNCKSVDRKYLEHGFMKLQSGFTNTRLEFNGFMNIFNTSFKVWTKKRSQGEPSYVTNKQSHSKYGNRPSVGDHMCVIFSNIPGKTCSSQGIEIAIKLVLDKFCPALLGLAEPEYDVLKTMYFPGYRLIKGKLSGGKKFRLNLLVKDTLVDYKIETFTTDVPAILVTVGQFKYLFYYREWKKDGKLGTDVMEMQEARWKTFLHRAKKVPGKLTLLGDANIDYLHKDTAHQNSLNNMREDMYEFLSEKGMGQIIKEETRRVKDHSGLLDHIYTKQLSHIAEIYNVNVHGHDHNSVGVLMRTDRPVFKRKVITKRNIDNVMPDDFQQVWTQSNPQEIFETRDLERMIEILEFKIHHCLDICCPEKKFVSSERYAPWVDKDLKRMMTHRDALRYAAIRGQRPWSEHEEKKKEVAAALKEAETAWKTKYLDFSDDKTGWQRLKLVSGLKQNTDKKMQLMVDGELEDDPVILAEYVNDFYITKVDGIAAEFPPNPVESVKYVREYLKDKEIGHFTFQKVSYRFVKKIIMRLKNVDSVGLDRIPVKVYKRFRSSLVPALTRIINVAIETSQYPQRFKDAIVCPVPKTGNLEEVKNWRPVSLLPVASRILEGVLCWQVREYMEGMSLIPPTQHAYRPNKSCVSAWLDLETRVTRAREEKKACGLLMSDLQGAFDVLSKETLLPKLIMCGFSQAAVAMLESYLTNRTARTKIGDHLSSVRNVDQGSGQGSVAGPLLWVLHLLCSPAVVERSKKIIEDSSHPERPPGMPVFTSTQYSILEVIFADDVNHLVTADSNENVLWVMQVIQGQYFKYFSSLGLKESRGKQMHILFSKVQEEGNEYCLNGRKQEIFVKLLGVTVSNKWSFDLHASRAIGRVQERIPHLMSVRKYLDKKVLYRVANALTVSILTYAIEVTGTKISIRKRLQKSMNRVLRCVTWGDRMTSVHSMLSMTDWMNMDLYFRYYSIMTLQRIILYKGSQEVHNLINYNYQRVRYETRKRSLYFFWKPKSVEGWNCSSQQALKNYNHFYLWSSNWFLEPEPGKDLQRWLKNSYPNTNL